MLSEAKKQELLRQIKQEVYNNPNKIYYGLYKDYSNCKGKIYNQKDNIYTVITSSFTYAKQLKDSGYIVYMKATDEKIIKKEKE